MGKPIIGSYDSGFECEVCTRCFFCCTTSTMVTEYDNRFFPFRKDLVWIRFRINQRYKDIKHFKNRSQFKHLVVTTFQYCQLLGIDDDLNPRCLIYGDRPKTCKEFNCWEPEE